MRRAIPALAAVAVATAGSMAEAATTPSLTARVVPKPVLLGNKATVSGRLSTGAAGVGVTLETSRFPFASGFSQAASGQTKANGDYALRFAPTLATRARVRAASQPPAQSKVVNAYVIAGYSHVSCKITTSSGDTSCSAPKGSGQMSIHLRYRRIWPASAYDSEAAKPVYVYFGKRNGPAAHPDSVTLRKTVSQTKLGNNRTYVSASHTFTAPTTKWSYQIATCIRFTESADGVGLPGHHGCGDQQVSYRQATPNTFG
jgi:hypothetical protein